MIKSTALLVAATTLALVTTASTAMASSKVPINTSDTNRQIVMQWAKDHGLSNEFSQSMTSSNSPSVIIGGGGSQAYYPGTSIACTPGDILLGSAASSGSGAGFNGHAAIVIDIEGDVAEISGSGPDFTTAAQFWNKESNQVAIERGAYTSIANNAATWAANYISANSSTYWALSNLFDTNSADGTYCSKLVWQAYYFSGYTLHYLVKSGGVDYCYPGDLLYNDGNAGSNDFPVIYNNGCSIWLT